MKKRILAFTLIFGFIIWVVVAFQLSRVNKIKYVFLFIGDGMATNQVELTEIYNNTINNNLYSKQEKLSFSKFENIGLRKNASGDSYITDSAASATVLASGTLTHNSFVNKDLDQKDLTPVTYDLKKMGYKIGIITNDSINGATPAAFYARANSRSDQDIILNQIVKSNFDIFSSAGLNASTSEEESNIIKSFEKNNYKFVNNDSTKLSKNNKYVINNDKWNALPEQLSEAIDLLDNKNGFFIMCEQAKIDWNGHSNDASGVIQEVNILDEAVNKALEFYKKHPNETIIIVTGDHETGGLVLANSELGYKIKAEQLKDIKVSRNELIEFISESDSFEDVKEYIKENYGITSKYFQEQLRKIYEEDKDSLSDVIYNDIYEQTGITYTTSTHTGTRVPVYAKGYRSEIFNGVYDSTEFNKKLKEILLVKE